MDNFSNVRETDQLFINSDNVAVIRMRFLRSYGVSWARRRIKKLVNDNKERVEDGLLLRKKKKRFVFNSSADVN